MTIQIECKSNKKSNPDIYYAHRMEEPERGNPTIIYKCGVCLEGDIFLIKKTNKAIAKKCLKCEALITVKNIRNPQKNKRIKKV